MKVFVIAMEKEAAPLIESAVIERDIKYCGKRVITCDICDVRCGMVICGVGKVNAAIGAQIAIDELGADTRLWARWMNLKKTISRSTPLPSIR